MAELTSEMSKSFIPIIDSILAVSDLNTISEKRIRKGLQAAVDYDLAPSKDALKVLIMSRFDLFMANKQAEENGSNDNSSEEITSSVHTNGAVHAYEKVKQEANPDLPQMIKPKKKRKIEAEPEDDAAFAARLQAMENSRSRNTRGGGAKPAKVVKRKQVKKKSATRIKGEDSSDADGDDSDAREKKVNRSGAFHKELMLSAPLSALFDGEVKLSRPQCVKRIWGYVREHDLQDPSDKRMIICDERLRPVFKQDKVHMFTMNKILNTNLYAIDE